MIVKRKIIADIISPFMTIFPSEKQIYSKNRLVILAHHGVEDIGLQHYPLAIGSISASTKQFEEQLRFIKNHFDVLTFKNLHENYLSQGIFPERGLIITFDDGYLNNYTNVFPLLQKYEILATIFLTTGNIGTNRMLRFDELYFRIFTTKMTSIKIDWPGQNLSFDIPDCSSKRKTALKIRNMLKKVSKDDRLQILEKIYQRLGPQNGVDDTRYVLNWKEILEMKDAGIEFGSHTVSHPILSCLSNSEVERELVESKMKIEEQLGEECIAFSYPNGGKGDFGEREISLLEKIGYEYAVSYIHGAETWRWANRYSLHRLQVELETTNSMFKVGCIWWPRFM